MQGSNLFFAIANNISYNKLEVEKIILKKDGFFKKCIVLYKIIRKISYS